MVDLAEQRGNHRVAGPACKVGDVADVQLVERSAARGGRTVVVVVPVAPRMIAMVRGVRASCLLPGRRPGQASSPNHNHFLITTQPATKPTQPGPLAAHGAARVGRSVGERGCVRGVEGGRRGSSQGISCARPGSWPAPHAHGKWSERVLGVQLVVDAGRVPGGEAGRLLPGHPRHVPAPGRGRYTAAHTRAHTAQETTHQSTRASNNAHIERQTPAGCSEDGQFSQPRVAARACLRIRPHPLPCPHRRWQSTGSAHAGAPVNPCTAGADG